MTFPTKAADGVSSDAIQHLSVDAAEETVLLPQRCTITAEHNQVAVASSVLASESSAVIPALSVNTFDAKRFLASVPSQPGVYRMYNAAHEVIYVGKAKDLKKRLSSYFRTNVDHIKTRALVSHIAHVEYTLTNTEAEALILENNLIKQYMPKYNVLLRDDKSFPYIVLTAHRHPRLTIQRGPRRIEGQYFGPYPSSPAIWQTLKLLQKIFPVRQCEDGFYRARTRPCLQHQIKLCSAPCVGIVSDDDYAEQVRLTRLVLSGKNQQVIEDLVLQMEQASQSLAFERAAQLRDQIQALREIQAQQRVSGDHEELDVLGFATVDGIVCIHVLFVRQHQVLGTRSFFPKIPTESSAEDIFTAFIMQFYLNGNNSMGVPSTIILSDVFEDTAPLSEALSQSAGRRIVLQSAKRGEKAGYLQLAEKNAIAGCQSKTNIKQQMALRYAGLRQLTGLADIARMECFDISHTMGQYTIASCVVFDSDGPLKRDYRRFNVEGITPGDDYAAMRFALHKRYGKLTDETKIPDVILIDGGQGQLQQAIDFFADWRHSKIPLLLGVAKGTSRKPGLETLLIAGRANAVNLASDAPALHLIQHIRDEAHRYAITGHRQKRGKQLLKSPLENIPGIGTTRRQALLQYLGGLQGVLKASVQELSTVPGISKQLAETIYQALQQRNQL